MTSYDLIKLGKDLSTQLNGLKINKNNTLVLQVPNDLLKKIDEDLYYRQNPSGKNFMASDKEINLTFDNLTLIIQSNA